ncbi:hypothetical protein CRG98_049303, partial [Punica granatum]
IREEINLWRSKNEASNGPHQLKIVTENPPSIELTAKPAVPELEVPTTSEKTVSCTSNIFRPPDRGEDYTILQALFSVDMLILF